MSVSLSLYLYLSLSLYIHIYICIYIETEKCYLPTSEGRDIYLPSGEVTSSLFVWGFDNPGSDRPGSATCSVFPGLDFHVKAALTTGVFV